VQSIAGKPVVSPQAFIVIVQDAVIGLVLKKIFAESVT
jgi:hypothetical protein